MAIATLYNGLPEYQWGPDLIEGGTLIAQSATKFQYKSDAGYTVTITGTGFGYDSDGRPIRGDATKITVANGDGKVFEITGVAAKLAILFNLANGYDREDNDAQNPDGFGFFSYVMRGNDTINGSDNGDDILAGRGTGNDIVNGLGGDDYIKGDAGNDKLDGGDGDDTLSYRETYFDTSAFQGISLNIATGKVTDAWGGTDTFKNFERYEDSVFDDVITGSTGNDRVRLGQGDDTFKGGEGNDRVEYRDSHRDGGLKGISVNLETGKIIDAWGNTDTVTSVEQVFGTQKADKFIGDDADNRFQGYKGKDSFSGGDGNDTVVFRDNDRYGSDVGVIVDLRLSSGQIRNDGFGNIETATSIENVEGSDLGDDIHGNDLFNYIEGNEGSDTIYGMGGEDDIRGGAGNDRIDGGTGPNHLSGEEGNDTLIGGADADDFNFNDLGKANADVIVGFKSKVDQIWLDPEAFGGGLVSGELTSAQFKAGAGLTQATTAAQRVLYDTSTGNLYYDADGKGGDSAVLFATLKSTPTLLFSDFEVF